MIQELLSIFRPGNRLKEMADEFAEMLRLTHEMTRTAGEVFFGEPVSREKRRQIYERDVRVNKLERSIRKRVVAHLYVYGNRGDLPYTLLLMSLVKDVERLGDYAKNLSEVADLEAGELPDDEIVAELRELRATAEETFRATAEIFAASDRERALPLIYRGKAQARVADHLVSKIARSPYDAATTTVLVLGARYYKRIGGHLLNVLSSVVMPLHKVDYYDEDEVPRG